MTRNGDSRLLSTKSRIALTTLSICVVIALCGTMFYVQFNNDSGGTMTYEEKHSLTYAEVPSFRIRWNPALAVAYVEEYTKLYVAGHPNGIGWDVINRFEGMHAKLLANSYLDKKVEKKRLQKDIDDQWVVIREEK